MPQQTNARSNNYIHQLQTSSVDQEAIQINTTIMVRQHASCTGQATQPQDADVNNINETKLQREFYPRLNAKAQ